MSTSAILPISSIDFGSTSATGPEQTLFNNVLSRLEQSISGGDLTTAQTLLNTINVLSPSSASASSPLGTFLTSLNTALQDKSATEAQTALSTYQSATGTTSTASAPSASDASATAAQIASQIIQTQNQQLLAATFASLSANSQPASSVNSSSNSSGGLYSLLAAANGQNSSSSATASDSTSPYDTALATLQASLATGNGTLTPALAYLQASGNFVNTTA